ncbi:MAG: electron transfer flavoprotein subunit alpha/FixB family protein [candidate division WOR-3 bacterium]
MSWVTVLVEHRQGTIRDVTLEMLAAARGLAGEMGGKVEALLLTDRETLLEPLAGQADRIVCVTHPELGQFNAERYQRVLAKLVSERRPDVVMVAHSAFGTDLAPSLAVELGAGLVSDAAGFRWTGEGLVVTRGMYGSKLNADRLVSSKPVLVMVRQSNFRPGPAGLATQVERWDASGVLAGGLRTRFVSLDEIPSMGIDITKADVIIGVGRGLKEVANLTPVKELADAIGAVVAGSRPVIDAGWLPKDCQVGSSGKTVKPRLYIALGISGAFQHVAGMRASETIIAVNKDPNAPIFSIAHYGIVDDMHKLVPALKQQLAELKA